ncbi:hypothetical protein [Staphylococcus capitis]|uniref:hypothetical protein n=1 Tax=Staphylococcus capitis TaxID=29388 RepID=UPI0022F110C1|nr:hypothetical protein [Staphylococcus capitis]MCG2403438.1 hypothetical protein [Staphylococcus epidermidis]
MKKLIIGLLCTTVCGTVLTTGSFNAQAESSITSYRRIRANSQTLSTSSRHIQTYVNAYR